jgi:hypothetical protein
VLKNKISNLFKGLSDSILNSNSKATTILTESLDESKTKVARENGLNVYFYIHLDTPKYKKASLNTFLYL